MSLFLQKVCTYFLLTFRKIKTYFLLFFVRLFLSKELRGFYVNVSSLISWKFMKTCVFLVELYYLSYWVWIGIKLTILHAFYCNCVSAWWARFFHPCFCSTHKLAHTWREKHSFSLFLYFVQKIHLNEIWQKWYLMRHSVKYIESLFVILFVCLYLHKKCRYLFLYI